MMPRVTPRPPVRSRSKIWELNGSIHCSIIGTCLTTAELRRVMAKVLPGDVAAAPDHDLHSQAVGFCLHQGPAAKLLQKALDQRHQTVIKRFSRLAGEAAVLAAWAEARDAGDIPGAYWAVLTHPDIGHEALRRAFGDVHMLSHLVGAANRADICRLTVLEAENASLRAKIEQQQMRLQEAVTTRDATIRQLGGLIAGQAQVLRDDDEDALAGLRHLVADLHDRLDRETARTARIERRAAEAVAAARASETGFRAEQAAREAAETDLAALERHTNPPAEGVTVRPMSRTILYVGGRPGAVTQMRGILEAAGGKLLAHDGGRHDQSSLLAGLIGQAALVMFPVDCVSHEAALLVKRLCRQLGTPWAPLRSSGLGSFLALLAQQSLHEETP